MRTHLVIQRGQISTQIRELQEQVQKLRPRVGAGVRVINTTAGVIRTASPVRRSMSGSSGGEARWA